MGSLINYSGVVVKVEAMERWRLKESDFEELASKPDVPAAVDYLKKFKPYEELFQGMEEKDLHREMIEQKLRLTELEEFSRLYQFANTQQKHFLDLYFMHYEIPIIKRCLRNAVGHTENKTDLSLFQKFLEKHSKLDLMNLSASDSLESFVKNLKGSAFFEPLDQMVKAGTASMAECESVLDMTYFKTMWEIRDKYLSKEEKKIVTQSFGTHLDMLNIQWIWRSRKFYSLPAEEIKSMLIPYGYHLKKEELAHLAESEDENQLHDALQGTWYGKYNFTDEYGELQFEEKVEEIEEKIYRESRKNNPWSAAVLNAHLYFKEKEVNRIIMTIEKVRYGRNTAR